MRRARITDVIGAIGASLARGRLTGPRQPPKREHAPDATRVRGHARAFASASLRTEREAQRPGLGRPANANGGCGW